MQDTDEPGGLNANSVTAKQPGAVAGFLLILVQLVLIAVVVSRFNVERSTNQHVFLNLLLVMFGGFAIHVWLPEAWRMRFFALLSCAGVVLYLEPRSGLLVLFLGAVLIGVGSLPVGLWARVILLALITGVLAFLRFPRATPLIADFPVSLWPVLGSMFMFRLALWLYDNHQTQMRPPLATTIAYFFMLPNVHFPLFPVVDFRKFRETWYDTDQWEICQRGIGWIVRGIAHLLLYRYISANLVPEAWQLVDLPHIAQFMAMNYALYLHVSGHFHVITGLLHLFGFNLPRTHHHYFFASSFTDIWRRINIYWKDFMAKLFFFPTFHAARRRGGSATVSIVVGVACVFVSTWLLHSWQTFWLLGVPSLSAMEAALWLAAGACVSVNALLDARQRRRKQRPTVIAAAIHATKVMGMFVLVSLFWGLWSTPDFAERLWSAFRRPGLGDGLVTVFSVVALLIAGGTVLRLVQMWRESRDSAVSHLSFRDTALIHAAGLGLVVAFATPEVNEVLGTKAQAVIAGLQSYEAESARQVHGYYEDLNTASIQAGPFLLAMSPHDETRRQQAHGFAKVIIEADDYQVVDLKPGIRSELNGNPFSVNQYGMRDRDTITLDKPDGTRRIAFVGSSIVMGYGVDDETVFSRQFERAVNDRRLMSSPVQVLNFGVGKQWPTHRLVRIQRKVFNFEPDAVWYFAHQDEFEALASHTAVLLKKGLALPSRYQYSVVESAGLSADMAEGQIQSRLSVHKTEMLGAVYRELVEECRERRILPVWIYLPVPGGTDDPGQEFREIAQQAGFIVCDLTGWHGEHNPADLFPGHDEHHPNAAGHGLITDALVELVESRDDVLPE